MLMHANVTPFHAYVSTPETHYREESVSFGSTPLPPRLTVHLSVPTGGLFLTVPAAPSQVLLQAAPLVELAQGIPASAKLDEQLDREFAAIMGHQPRVRVRKFRP